MKDDLRQGSNSTISTTSTVVSGTTTTDSAEMVCGCPEPGPETIEVEQVLGAEMKQKVVEFDMTVPDDDPPIEQVIDVYVKDVELKTIDVIRDKVIVRGELEVKVMYVADEPDTPVRALEKKHVRFTRDIDLEGAMPGMDATADVNVEYVDYDFHRHHHNRLVHITIVLKFWARVVTTTQMDVYALGAVDEVGQIEMTTTLNPTGDTVSASTFATDTVSAAQTGGGNIAGYGPENVFVTGPGLTPMAGTPMTTSGTATVTGSVVNVRSGPGTNFPVVTKVKQNATVTLKDQAFGWYRVVLEDGTTTGWIASWLLSVGTTGAKG